MLLAESSAAGPLSPGEGLTAYRALRDDGCLVKKGLAMEWLISRCVHSAGAGSRGIPREHLLPEFLRWILGTYASIGAVAGGQGDLDSRKDLDAGRARAAASDARGALA